MKRSLVLISVFLAVAACKTQTAVAPLVIRDSISITYKQGTVQPLSISNIEEQPTPIGVRGAAIESRKNSSVPADGSVGLGATQGASVFEGLLSQRTNKPAVPPSPTIRVDTVFVERWHTQTIREPTPPPSGGAREGASKFYKDCTWGFFILLLLILGRIALKMWKRFFFLS